MAGEDSDEEAALSEDAPFVWLVQEEAGGSSGSGAGWTPVRARDNRHLERAWLEQPSSVVPVDFGRYDVDLKGRTIRSVYWDEPERRILRSSWFYGKGSERTPYEEDDAGQIETAFQRLRSGRERVPLLVPVNRGSHDVRFEALQPVETNENALSALSYLIGAGSEKRHSVVAAPAVPLPLPAAAEPGGKAAGQAAQQWTAVQESVDRSREQAPVPVWRGHGVLDPERAEAALEEDDEEWLPEAVDCLVFVVHGIGQYHRSQQGAAEAFYREVGKVRSLAAKCLRQRLKDGLPVNGRIEFLPLEWFEPIHVDVGIGNRLQQITLPSVVPLRDFANFAIADIMVYLDDDWRETIHRELQRKMDRLWSLYGARTPEYSGKVSIIGHSLGAVIMFDLIQKSLPQLERGLLVEPPEFAEEPPPPRSQRAEGCCPVPRCFFAIGSPLGMFLSIRFSQKGQSAAKYFRGLDVRWPAGSVGCGWRFFNIFHPDDPIAYRVEPLLNPDYKDTPPKVVLHRGGLRFHHQMRQWWHRTVGSSGTSARPAGEASPSEAQAPPESTLADVLLVPSAEGGGSAAAGFLEDAPGRPRQTAAVDRLDWALQEGVLESMNELLSAIHSHFAYWDCEDLVQFVADQLVDALETKHREHPPPGHEGTSPRHASRRRGTA